MVGKERSFAGRAKLAYDNGPLRVTGSVSYSDDDNDGFIPVNVQFVPDNLRRNYETRVFSRDARPVVPGQPYVTSSPTISRGETEVFTGTLDIALDVGEVTLRSITGYVDTNDLFRWDLSGGTQFFPGAPFVFVFDRTSNADARQWSQELQATGSSLDNKLNWLVGLYYFNETGNQTFVDAFFGGAALPLFTQRTKTNSYAAFAQANYAISDKTSITLGGRYTRDDKEFVARIDAPSNISANLNASFDAFTPRIGLEHKFNQDVLGYLSVSKGFKAGGFNGLSRNPAQLNTIYRPQTVWAYEGGLKAETFDRRLRTNLAIFINDISDLQQTAQSIDTPGQFPIQNVGDARIWGVELEVSARPVSGLDLFAAVSYNNDRYKSLIPTSEAAVANARDIPLVSEWQARLGGTFEQPISEKLLFRLGGNMNYTGPYNSAVNNVLDLQGWTCIDAFVALATADKKWELNLSGQNLTDEVTYVSGIVAGLPPALTPLRPRTYMVTLKFNY
jgi:iron complex outermembrane receptor protein